MPGKEKPALVLAHVPYTVGALPRSGVGPVHGRLIVIARRVGRKLPTLHLEYRLGVCERVRVPGTVRLEMPDLSPDEQSVTSLYAVVLQGHGFVDCDLDDRDAVGVPTRTDAFAACAYSPTLASTSQATR